MTQEYSIGDQQKLVFYHFDIFNYKEAWDFQEHLYEQVLENSSNNTMPLSHHLIFCQHNHVYTLGQNGSENNLLINQIQLKAKNAEFYKINRGGDITYHGPGQLVGYPILNLSILRIGVKQYIYLLEQVIIDTLFQYEIKAGRKAGATGVWIDVDKAGLERKICAIGVRCSHWITMHGFALNINTDLSYFNYINPCGFVDKAVTSIEKELGQKICF